MGHILSTLSVSCGTVRIIFAIVAFKMRNRWEDKKIMGGSKKILIFNVGGMQNMQNL